MRGHRAAARTVAGLCVAAVALAGCGAEQASRPGPDATGGSHPVEHPSRPPTDAVVASHGLVLQVGEGAVLCNGDIAESAPPQCTGPTIASWDWEDAENAGLDITDEVDTWWADDVWVVGTLDGDTLTPTEPVSTEPPQGVNVAEPDRDPVDCDDPLSGVEAEVGDADGNGTGEAMRLATEAEGFIGNRISGDGSRISVALHSRVGAQGADALLEAIREVYSGPVCLELRDGPSAAELDEIARSMRTDDAPWTEVIGSDGNLLVRTEVVDDAARDRAREQVAGRLDDDAIHLTGRYYVLDDVEAGEGAEETGQAAGGDAYPLEVAPGDELQGVGSAIEDDEGTRLCLGATLLSLPPQCGDAELAGWDWSAVEYEEMSGVRWSGPYKVIGTYDGDTFTLSRAPQPADDVEPHPGAAPVEQTFPALCTDPYRGGDEGHDGELGLAFDVEGEAASTIPGYVAHYVSDGNNHLNVLVTEGTDVEAVHAQIRETWPGFLCVGMRGTATDADFRAAQEAVSDLNERGVWGVGPHLGVLRVDTVLADEATVAAVREAAAPWLGPDQIAFTSALWPVTDAD